MPVRGFTIDHFLALRQPTVRVPLHLSPDGSLLAVSVQPKRRAAAGAKDDPFTPEGVMLEMLGSHVALVDTATGLLREPFDGTSWGAQWSPDGRLLAAYVQHGGPVCLAIWERGEGRTTLHRAVRTRAFFGFEVPRWAADSRTVVVRLAPAGRGGRGGRGEHRGAEEDSPADVIAFDPRHAAEAPPPGWLDAQRGDIAAVDAVTGAARVLLADIPVRWWQVAPDGHAAAVAVAAASVAERQQIDNDLRVVPLDGGEARTVARRVPQHYGVCFAWSPDSRSLAYTASERGQPDRLFVVPADGSLAPRELTDPIADWGVAQDYEPPRWSADGRLLYCLAPQEYGVFALDGSRRELVRTPPDRELVGWVQRPTDAIVWPSAPDAPLLVARDPATKRLALTRAAPGGAPATTVAEAPKLWHGRTYGVEAAADGSAVYLLLEAADHPAEIWRWESPAGPLQRLAPLNPDLEATALGTSRLIGYRALDGELRRAALLLPPDYREGQQLLVVVQVYGGSLGSDRLHQFGGGEDILNGQLLASHGYAVLSPDCPLTDRDPLRQIPGQVVPAVNRLVELGITDWRRVGVIGNSYGGYTVLALLTQCPRFRAAVANAGLYDLVGAYGVLRDDGSPWLGWAETGQGRLGGTPWERRDAYIENSPFFSLDRVQTPLLLTCGTEDIVPPAQAEAVFVGLRRLGKRVELRRYRGEDHWPGMWREASVRDLHARVLAWFDEHLRG